jgi:hypothetical protein
MWKKEAWRGKVTCEEAELRSSSAGILLQAASSILKDFFGPRLK